MLSRRRCVLPAFEERVVHVITAKPVVGPRRSPPQALVLNDRVARNELLLAAIVFKPLVRPQPDTVAIPFHFTTAIASAAARAIALVFRAL